MNDSGAPAPQHSFGPDDELAPPAAAEPELREAVADLDAAPPPAPVSAEAPHAEQQAEPPRRRSTVRERAPITSSDDAPPPASTAPVAPAPAPEPVITEVAATEGANQPRKTGWWSRRFAGG
jgi:ribonuclease E